MQNYEKKHKEEANQAQNPGSKTFLPIQTMHIQHQKTETSRKRLQIMTQNHRPINNIEE